MDFPAMKFKQQPTSTPPKLSLFSLPSKPPTLPDGLTPPSNAVAAIPFLWEEAPGRPRVPTTSDDPPKSKTVRSLDLPPRLTVTTLTPYHNPGNNNNIAGIDIIPSPTTVLGGPYEGVCGSNNFPVESSEKMGVGSNSGKSKGRIRVPLRKLMRKERSPVKFRSWRWEGLKDVDGGEGERSPSIRFCSWRWDSFRDNMGGSNGVSFGTSSVGKIEKVERKNSFASLGRDTPNRFLANMYGTLKQAMPWRPRR